MNRRLAGIALLCAVLTGFTYPPAVPGSGDSGSFEHKGQSVRLVKQEGYRSVPVEWVQHALSNHLYPHDLESFLGAEFPIYLVEQQIVTNSGHAVAVTINGEVILFSGSENPDRASIEETALHEVSHALAARTMTDQRWDQYRALRGLGPEYRRNAVLWHRRPSEIFAEDFAHLFGTEAARQAAWQFPELSLPDEVAGLREFFVDLVSREDPAQRGRVPLAALRAELSRMSGISFRLADLPWKAEGPLTRAQAAYLLSLALPSWHGRHLVGRSDVSNWPAWSVRAIEQVQGHGLLPARADGRFEPDEFLGAADFDAALQRLREQPAHGSMQANHNERYN